MNSQYLDSQLKFRVYDKKKQRLCEDAPLFISKEGELLRRKVTSVRDDFNSFRFERLSFELFEVHKSSGFKDQNQKEIFANDCVWDSEKKQIFHIVHKDGQFMLSSIENHTETLLTGSICKHLLIMGLIYEESAVLKQRLLKLEQV